VYGVVPPDPTRVDEYGDPLANGVDGQPNANPVTDMVQDFETIAPARSLICTVKVNDPAASQVPLQRN
jgi:hypothetical protein